MDLSGGGRPENHKRFALLREAITDDMSCV